MLGSELRVFDPELDNAIRDLFLLLDGERPRCPALFSEDGTDTEMDTESDMSSFSKSVPDANSSSSDASFEFLDEEDDVSNLLSLFRPLFVSFLFFVPFFVSFSLLVVGKLDRGLGCLY